MQNLVQRIDVLLRDRSLLNHPFYELWSAGALTREALSGYALEYYQLVKAVPRCVSKIADTAPEPLHTGIRANQAEEEEHIPLWEAFAQHMGHSKATLQSYKGLPGTQQAVASFESLCSTFAKGASTMYAFEKPLPEISETKRKGLAAFYGIQAADAIDYFHVHAVVDIAHAEHWGTLLKQQPEQETDALFAQAEASVDCQHQLLDACMEAYCHHKGEAGGESSPLGG